MGGRKLRVGVIFGGRSGEHEVSLASAASVMGALEPARYEVVPIGITREGRWVTGGDPMGTLRDAAGGAAKPPGGDGPGSALDKLDVVFPVLHGPYGEDGTVQGLLELLDLPYVGGGVTASAVGMDKILMKAAFQSRGLPMVEFVALKRMEWEAQPAAVLARMEERIGYPCFVKPANLGSSVGVSRAEGRPELEAGLALAARYDRKLLVERAVPGREIEVSVLGNDEPEASVPGEVVPKKAWYDYEAKYREGMAEIRIPAPLSRDLTETVRRMAVEAFLAVDCAGMARVDFFLERGTDRFLVNEINTIPGFTTTSAYPKLWEATGLPYPRLIDRLIALALERHAERARSACR